MQSAQQALQQEQRSRPHSRRAIVMGLLGAWVIGAGITASCASRPASTHAESNRAQPQTRTVADLEPGDTVVAKALRLTNPVHTGKVTLIGGPPVCMGIRPFERGNPIVHISIVDSLFLKRGAELIPIQFDEIRANRPQCFTRAQRGH